MTLQQIHHQSKRILRKREVLHRTGLSNATLHEMIAAQRFPAQIRISTRSVGWIESEVDAWIDERIAASRQKAA
ncbi:AlpA family transcriptional regulator [Oxalobacter vibrioformis]|uniref:AlpA family transcriptional regulator n=1 Tax=Oxalobacter vibrioformis TaxID=933080 RepID=A0A9E9P2R3_9BURK|nr:AlpA family transcriptional regulator [Oxalobacter vibrioformis]WAW09283.1 AlpA family transcriptional regulator [Oxalobacter vibrioformis]